MNSPLIRNTNPGYSLADPLIRNKVLRCRILEIPAELVEGAAGDGEPVEGAAGDGEPVEGAAGDGDQGEERENAAGLVATETTRPENRWIGAR